MDLARKLFVFHADPEITICDLRALFNRALHIGPVTTGHCEHSDFNNWRRRKWELRGGRVRILVNEYERRRPALRITKRLTARAFVTWLRLAHIVAIRSLGVMDRRAHDL